MLAASATSYPEVVSLLIDAGADINFQPTIDNYYFGPSALMHAIQPQTRDPFTRSWSDAEPNYEVISAFITAGAEVNATTRDEDQECQTVLMWALESQSSPAVIAALIKAGADVNSIFWSYSSYPGETPLLVAISSQLNLEVISLLIDAGADVNVIRDDGVTPLIEALELFKYASEICAASLPELISMLIKAGADVNYQEEIADSEWTSELEDKGFTVLMYALEYEASPAVFSLLLEAGADVHAKSNEGKTVLEYAAEMDLNPEVEALLASKEK